MKKLFFVLAIAAFAVACDNAANTAGEKKDSLDSVEKLQKESVDEAAKDAKEGIDSTMDAKKDSVEAAHENHVDSTKK